MLKWFYSFVAILLIAVTAYALVDAATPKKPDMFIVVDKGPIGGPSILRDRETGCDYIQFQDKIVPRVNAFNLPICNRR